eukprot:5292239-Pyramimonas_sp.AAC.2
MEYTGELSGTLKLGIVQRVLFCRSRFLLRYGRPCAAQQQQRAKKNMTSVSHHDYRMHRSCEDTDDSAIAAADPLYLRGSNTGALVDPATHL